MLFLILSFLFFLLLGFLFICLLWPDKSPLQTHVLTKICLSFGLGIGLASCGFFILIMIFDLPFHSYVLIEITIITILFMIILRREKTKERGSTAYPDSVSGSAGSPVLAATFYIVLAAAIGAFILLSLKNPHGQWDAWAAWNMRARFIFRAEEHWKDLFADFLHNRAWDYPLLLTGIIARCWRYIRSDTVLVPVLISAFSVFATCGVLFSSVRLLRGKNQGYLAGLVLLGTTLFIAHGSSQYGDVSLGLFFLSVIALLTLRDRFFENNHSLLFLTGITAGFAAWTKHEGLIFMLSIAIARLLVVIAAKGWGKGIKEMAFFCLGALPVALTLIYYKTHVVSVFFAHFSYMDSQSALAKLSDFSKYLLILGFFWRKLLDFGNGVVGVIPLLAVYLFLLGIRIRREDRIAISASGIAIFLMSAAYFFNYLLTPPDVSIVQMVVNSIDRFFLQLWPSFLFVYFMIAKPPGETILAYGKPSSRRQAGPQTHHA